MELAQEQIGSVLFSGKFSVGEYLRGERTRAAIAAGCDLVLHCNGRLDEMQAVARDSPMLAGAAATRSETLQPVLFGPAGLDTHGLPLVETSEEIAMDDKPAASREAWERSPPHYWAVVGEAKDGAEVLAALPGKPPREAAVLARHSYGFGRVLFVGLDSTWRWRCRRCRRRSCR